MDNYFTKNYNYVIYYTTTKGKKQTFYCNEFSEYTKEVKRLQKKGYEYKVVKYSLVA